MTARTVDTNGWIEIKDNPISKVGVFEYLGNQLPAKLGLDPNKIYNVYRSEEELGNDETINSFKLLPWTDNHPDRLLGNKDSGLVPAEYKGVHGVIGENVTFDGEYLRANLKVFSQELADLINSGKKELSIGYKSAYNLAKGMYNGQPYDLVQTKLRGNHISLVDEGRSGPSVSVLDKKEEVTMNKEDMSQDESYNADPEHEAAEALTLAGLAGQVKELKLTIEKLLGLEAQEQTMVADADEDNEKEYIKKEIEEDKETNDEDAPQMKKVESMDEDKEDDNKSSAMDAVALKKSVFEEISKRDKLASRLSNHVGTFDSSTMTLDEVASYGVKKLNLNCPRGQESVMLSGYLAGKTVSKPVAQSFALDTKIKSSKIDQYLNGGK